MPELSFREVVTWGAESLEECVQISFSQEKLRKRGGGEKVSFLQQLGLERNVKLHSFLPSRS